MYFANVSFIITDLFLLQLFRILLFSYNIFPFYVFVQEMPIFILICLHYLCIEFLNSYIITFIKRLLFFPLGCSSYVFVYYLFVFWGFFFHLIFVLINPCISASIIHLFCPLFLISFILLYLLSGLKFVFF